MHPVEGPSVCVFQPKRGACHCAVIQGCIHGHRDRLALGPGEPGSSEWGAPFSAMWMEALIYISMLSELDLDSACRSADPVSGPGASGGGSQMDTGPGAPPVSVRFP